MRDEVRGKKIQKGMPGRLAETLQTVRDSTSLKDAAKERGLAESTIVTHLEQLAELGKLEKKDFAKLLPEKRDLTEIEDAWEEVGGEKLTPVFQALGGRYSFEVIRLVRLLGKV